MKKVSFVSLGGTITMKPTAAGIVPKLTAEDLLEVVPGVQDRAQVVVHQTPMMPGASLALADIFSLAKTLDAALEQQTDGAVIAQGTDTIEETAFLLSLLVQSDKPVIVTGAMRGADAVSTDGPANLDAAFLVASASASAGRGAMVVLNNEIHAPVFVSKNHASALESFVSRNSGPLGCVSEGEVFYFVDQYWPVMPKLKVRDGQVPAVAIVKASLGEGPQLLEAVGQSSYDGLVVEAMGAGHVPQVWVEELSRLAARMPVVLATRVSEGRVHQRTYGFAGSEIDLISRGLIPSGFLCPLKSRLLLAGLLASGKDQNEIRQAFSFNRA